MDYDYPIRPRRRPPTFFQRNPLGGRLVLLVGFFVLTIPVLAVVTGHSAATVKTTGADRAALITPVITVPAAPSPASTIAPTAVVAAVAEPAAPQPIVADIATADTLDPKAVAALPDATIAATPKQAVAAAPAPTTVFDVNALPDAVPADAAPTPAATVAKPTATVPKAVPTTKAPTPAKTAAPKTTTPPKTTAPKPTAAPRPPVTAPKPVTTTAKPTRHYSQDEVKALIEQMWPADSLAKALDVAWKESNYQATADNHFCCLGVFQINYSSHARRLAARGLGRDGLFDPKVNIEIALEIFHEQGWSPWTTA